MNILCGYNSSGDEIIKSTRSVVESLEFLLCHPHPKMRPLDYTIVKYFNTLNPNALGYAAKTKVRVGDVDYADISIFNGEIPVINMPRGMAYGTPGCPITTEDLKENMLVFAYLITKIRSVHIDYFNEKIGDNYVNMKFAKVLADARAHFQAPGFQGIPNFLNLGIVPMAAPMDMVMAAPMPMPMPMPMPCLCLQFLQTLQRFLFHLH